MDAAAHGAGGVGRRPHNVPWADWTRGAHADYEANLVPQPLPGDIDMPAIVAVLQKHLPADAVLTNGAGNFASWMHRFYRHHGLAKGRKTQLAPTSGAMGYGVPAGIAASLVSGRTVFTIAGDGDFLMTGQELATAVQFGGKSIIVLLNNGMYGTIRMHQEREYPQHVQRHAAGQPRLRRAGACLRLCRRAHHPDGGVRARTGRSAGAAAGHADRGDAGSGGDHHARHAERDSRRRRLQRR